MQQLFGAMVWHTVEWTDADRKYRQQLLAASPQDAIRIVKQNFKLIKALT